MAQHAKKKPPRQPGDMHTIRSFCQTNSISEGYYYKLQRQGLGPAVIKLGHRTLITPEAEQDWRRARAAASSTPEKAAQHHESERLEN